MKMKITSLTRAEMEDYRAKRAEREQDKVKNPQEIWDIVMSDPNEKREWEDTFKLKDTLERARLQKEQQKDREALAQAMQELKEEQRQAKARKEAAKLLGLEDDEQSLGLPPELDIERARYAFNNAIKAQYITIDNKGWHWKTGRGNKVKLAYLCERIYSPNHIDPVPWGALDKLFNEIRIKDSASQIYSAKKQQRWMAVIDTFLSEKRF